MSQPTRPRGLPEEAAWNADEHQWELGAKNAEDQPIGDWVWWDTDGNLVCKAAYDDHGELHGWLERWHPNGERAQWSPWVHGKTHGVQAWTLASDGPSDKYSTFPPNAPAGTMRMDMPYYHGEAQPFHFTFFEEGGRDLELPVDENGHVQELATHLEHIIPETTLLLIAPGTSIKGAELVEEPGNQTRWIYAGKTEDGWRINQSDDRPESPRKWVVDTETMNRCFTLSTDAFLAWMESRRPADVPQGARWERTPPRWWYGAEEGGKRTGEWTSWDDQGRVRGTRSYEKPGILHGPTRRLHEDGTVAADGQYTDGRQTGRWFYERSDAPTDETFPGEHPDVWRIEIYYLDTGVVAMRRYFQRDGTLCSAEGSPLVAEYDDETFAEASVDGWFKAYLPVTFEKDEYRRPVDAARSYWEELTGAPPHPDHDAVASFVIDRRGGSVFGWRWAMSIDGRREIMRGNVVENAIHWGQTLLMEFLSGTTSIGGQYEGCTYMLSLIDVELGSAERPPILAFDKGMQSSSPFAVDIDHFAFFVSAIEAFCADKLSPSGLAEVWKVVSGRVQPVGPYAPFRDDFGPDDFEDWTPDASIAQTLARRSLWIVALLAGWPMDEVAERFADDDASWVDPLYSVENAVRHVPIGLYSLWRRFFFDEEEELVALIAATKGSPARVLRDAAELIEELMYGREFLCGIEDVHELRDEFLDLGLSYSPN